MKREYLEKIRNSSAYPTLRGFATFFSVSGYILAASTVTGFVSMGDGYPLVGIAVAVVIVLLTRLAKESALLLADLADAALDIGSRGLLDTPEKQPTAVSRGGENLKCSECGHMNEGFAYKCAKCQKALLAST